MIRRDSKNKHQKNMCSKEIGLRAQNIVTVLSLIVNTTEKNLYNHLISTRRFTLIMNKNIHMSSKIYEQNDYDLDNLDLLIVLW